MNLVVLATLGFLACDFYIYVLIHWIRQTRRKTANRSIVEDQANDFECGGPKRPIPIRPGRSEERQDRLRVQSEKPASAGMRSRSNSLGCRDCERNAYESIARSWNPARKSKSINN